MSDSLAAHPKHGDVYGDPIMGHRVEVIHAAVVVYANGSEGLASAYTFGAEGQALGRVTFVSSDLQTVAMLKRALAEFRPPPGGRFEWREYRR